MRRNRNKKIKKNSVLTAGTCWIVALIVFGLMITMVYYVLDSRCDQIAREIGQLEKRHAELVSECGREAAKWDEKDIRERMEEKLARFGLEMGYARYDQIVCMDPDGRPMKKSATTIARARARARAGELALNIPVSPVRSVMQQRSTVKRVASANSSRAVARR